MKMYAVLYRKDYKPEVLVECIEAESVCDAMALMSISLRKTPFERSRVLPIAAFELAEED